MTKIQRQGEEAKRTSASESTPIAYRQSGVANLFSLEKVEGLQNLHSWASNGQDAVEKASQLNPDLIILDVTMPNLDGFAAARQIRTFLPEVPILILSMHEGHTVVSEAQQAGAQGFVSKRDAANMLLKAVDAILQGQTFFPI